MMKKLLSIVLTVMMIATMLVVPLTVSAKTPTDLGKAYVFDLTKTGIYNYGASNGEVSFEYDGRTIIPFHSINGSNHTAGYEKFTTPGGKQVDSFKYVSNGQSYLTLLDKDGTPFEMEPNKTYTIKFDMYYSGTKYNWVSFNVGQPQRAWTWEEGGSYPLKSYAHKEGKDSKTNMTFLYDAQMFYNGEAPVGIQHFSGSKTITTPSTLVTQTYNEDGTEKEILDLNPYLGIVFSGSTAGSTAWFTHIEVIAEDAEKQVNYYVDGQKVNTVTEGLEGEYTPDFTAPAKEGYTFAGWYTDPTLSTPFAAAAPNGSAAFGDIKVYDFATEAPVLNLFARYTKDVQTESINMTFGANGNVKGNSNIAKPFTAGDITRNYVPNMGYASKIYNADSLTISARSAISTSYGKVKTEEGVTYFKPNDPASNPWNEGAPIMAVNPDGSLYQPLPNSKYRITITYDNPTTGRATEAQQLTVFTGYKYDRANYNSGEPRGNTAELGPDAFSETYSNKTYSQTADKVTVSYELNTGNFTTAAPCLGIYVRSAGAKIDFDSPKDFEGETYYPVTYNDFNIYSMTVECFAYRDLEVAGVTAATGNGSDGFGGTANIAVPMGGKDVTLTESYGWYKIVIFDWDNENEYYVVKEVYEANGVSKKGVVIPATGFAYLIHENLAVASWNKFASSFSLIGSGYGAGNAENLIGKKAYIYGADLQTLTTDNISDYKSEDFVLNTYISIGKDKDPTNYAYNPTVKSGLPLKLTHINNKANGANGDVRIFADTFGDYVDGGWGWWFGLSAEWDEAQNAFVITELYNKDNGKARKDAPIPKNGFVVYMCDLQGDKTYKNMFNTLKVGDLAYLYGVDYQKGTMGSDAQVCFFGENQKHEGEPVVINMENGRLAAPVMTKDFAAFDGTKDYTITWNAVEGAAGYLVKFNKANNEVHDAKVQDAVSVTDTQYVFTAPETDAIGDRYTVTVTAIGTDKADSRTAKMTLQYVSEAAIDPENKLVGKKVVFLGDSLTERDGYVRITGGLTGANVINSGIGGNTTKDALARFERDVLAHNPDIVVIGFGMNDQAAVKYMDFASFVSVADYKANLINMVDQLQAKGITVVLVTPNPVKVGEGFFNYNSENSDWDYDHGYMPDFVNAMREVAEEKGTELVDIYEEFNKIADNGYLYAGNGDGIHLSAEGGKFYAEKVSAKLMAMANPPAFTLGDVNGDGAVDTVDLSDMKLYLAGALEDGKTFILDAANFNPEEGEGVDTVDLSALKLQLAGA